MLQEYELFMDSFRFACKNFKGNTENADIAATVGFETNKEYNEKSLVYVRKDGMYVRTDALSNMRRSIAKHVKGLEHFHFHLLRHTFTSNLLTSGAPPKDVQELLGHLALSTTMNIYSHATRDAKRNSVRLLAKKCSMG